MELKKSKYANLERRRKSFLLIGLSVSTGLVLMAFEWSTVSYKETLEARYDERIYDIPFTAPADITILTESESQPKTAKEVNHEEIIVTENIVETIEQKVDEQLEIDLKNLLPVLTGDNPTNKRQTTIIDPADLEDLGPMNLGPSIDIPYYDYCAGQSHEQIIACISKEIHQTINVGMSDITPYQIEANKKSKMYVRFVIGKDGKIEELTIAGEENFHPAIIKMVKKSMAKIPQMHPALLQGKPVPVYFGIPITFNIQ